MVRTLSWKVIGRSLNKIPCTSVCRFFFSSLRGYMSPQQWLNAAYRTSVCQPLVCLSLITSGKGHLDPTSSNRCGTQSVGQLTWLQFSCSDMHSRNHFAALVRLGSEPVFWSSLAASPAGPSVTRHIRNWTCDFKIKTSKNILFQSSGP